ncbi:MAG: hypothetical protein WAL63_17485 [Solirubrobacteraceae bacterium]
MGPPTATINAPADGSIVRLGASIVTSFACSDNVKGPGIRSCVDSNGATVAAGATVATGRLDTRRLGLGTYTVVAASSDGQTGTATIHYRVNRTGRGVRPVVKLPARLLNAAVQPCALIACPGNPGPHINLMNAIGNQPSDYCTMYACSPMDLIPDHGLDYNLFPYDPDWAYFAQNSQLPDALSLCNGYNGSAPYLGSPPCTSQPITEDNPSPDSFSHYICKHGRHPLDAYHGHVNYEPATYQGILQWYEKSDPGSDDEYSLDLHPSPTLDGVTAGNNNSNSIHIEFDSDETVDHFDDNAWWNKFHTSVDRGHAVDYNGGTYVNGRLAVVTGLVGIDTVHGASAELHPVYAIAIRTTPEYAPPTSGLPADQWAFFARNFGDEGYCSSNGHPLPDGPLRVLIPWRQGATGVSVNPNSDVWSNINPQASAAVIPNVGVLLTFPLTPASSQPLYWGTIDLRWTFPTAPGSVDAATLGPAQLGAMFGAPVGPTRQPIAGRPNGGDSADVEGHVGKLWQQLPRGKRMRALAHLPHPIAHLPHTTRVRIAMAPPPRGLLAPPGSFVFPRHAPVVVKRATAEAQSLCSAYGNIVPGLPKAACPRSRGAAAHLDSGIRGRVLYGPTCPVQRPGFSCERPYQGSIAIRREPTGTLVMHVRSGAGGRFTAYLAPGAYLLVPRDGRPYPRARGQAVSVRRDAFTAVTIRYDSGVR